MVYLIAQISMFLVLAALIGLSLGWLLWGELARRIRTEAAASQSKLADLEVRHWATLSERDAFEKKILDRESEIAGLRKRVLEPALSAHEMDEKVQAALAEKDSVIANLRDQQRETLALVEERDQSVIDLRARLSATEAHEQALSARAREWEPAMADKDSMIAELNSKIMEQDARHWETISELEKKIESLFAQHQVLAGGQEKLRGTISEKDGEIARMQTRLGAASATLAAASREHESALAAAAAEIARLRQIGALLQEPLPHDEVTKIAHGYAAARNFQGGSERDDWSRAENEVRLRIVRDYLSLTTSVGAGA